VPKLNASKLVRQGFAVASHPAATPSCSVNQIKQSRSELAAPNPLTTSNDTIMEFAGCFLRIFDEGDPGPLPLAPIDSLNIDDAYRVQDAVLELRKFRGETVVGYKVGCTSRAIREQFGLQTPIFGRLLKPHIYPNGSILQLSNFTSCALEPEFVFHIGRDIRVHDIDDDALLKSIEFISPGLEVHNYRFWFERPTSQELIASNGIHACLVIGDDKREPNSVGLTDQEVALLIDDELQGVGRGADIMDGGPLLSLRELVKFLVSRGDYLRAGQYVIPGSPVRLIPAMSGTIARATLAQIGSVEARFI